MQAQKERRCNAYSVCVCVCDPEIRKGQKTLTQLETRDKLVCSDCFPAVRGETEEEKAAEEEALV